MIEDGKIIGYMMLGRITDKKNKVELVGAVLSRCREYGVDGEIEEKIKRIKYRNEKQIQAAEKYLTPAVNTSSFVRWCVRRAEDS